MSEKYIDTGRINQKLKTRKKIIQGAQGFLAKGQAFTLEDVATASGMSRATVYRYYSNVEAIAAEAALDLNLESPEEIYQMYQDLPLNEAILGIQEHINRFSINNEATLRKFLSVVIAGEAPATKRGARRISVLSMAFQGKNRGPETDEIKNLIHIATILMGMEAFIVAKDVCRLGNQEAKDVLKWGLEKLLQAVLPEIEN